LNVIQQSIAKNENLVTMLRLVVLVCSLAIKRTFIFSNTLMQWCNKLGCNFNEGNNDVEKYKAG
jgi:hypothetical protein